MKTISHRLTNIDPKLYLLNDDGASRSTIFIHGANFDYGLCQRPDPDEYRCLISRAQISGRVFLLSWRSGFYGWLPHSKFLEVEDNAHRLGICLQALLLKVPRIRQHTLTLIGHSLGAHVIASALTNSDWKQFKLRDVILLGAAVGEQDFEGLTGWQFWRRCAGQVRRKIINCYSSYDTQLWRRRLLRWDQLQCIGRERASYSSSKIKNISFTCKLPDEYDHDYLSCFDRVMDRIYPKRLRSTSYQVQALCDCPWCEKAVLADANEDVECPWCNIVFEYRTANDELYWRHEPLLISCPRCESGKIVVQDPGEEKCARCRRRFDFSRRGSEVWSSEVGQFR